MLQLPWICPYHCPGLVHLGGALIDSLCVGIPTPCQLHVVHNGEIVPGAARTTAALGWSPDRCLQTTDGHTLKNRLRYIVGSGGM